MLQQCSSFVTSLPAKARDFRDSLSVPIKVKAHKVTLRAEHWGFVAVAAVDAFHFHQYLFAVSIWLLITGLLAEFIGD